jgi:hypothetical protein
MGQAVLFERISPGHCGQAPSRRSRREKGMPRLHKAEESVRSAGRCATLAWPACVCDSSSSGNSRVSVSSQVEPRRIGAPLGPSRHHRSRPSVMDGRSMREPWVPWVGGQRELRPAAELGPRPGILGENRWLILKEAPREGLLALSIAERQLCAIIPMHELRQNSRGRLACLSFKFQCQLCKAAYLKCIA